MWYVFSRCLLYLLQFQLETEMWKVFESIRSCIPQDTISILIFSAHRIVAACISQEVVLGCLTFYSSLCLFNHCIAFPFVRKITYLYYMRSLFCLPNFIVVASLFYGIAFSLSGSVFYFSHVASRKIHTCL